MAVWTPLHERRAGHGDSGDGEGGEHHHAQAPGNVRQRDAADQVGHRQQGQRGQDQQQGEDRGGPDLAQHDAHRSQQAHLHGHEGLPLALAGHRSSREAGHQKEDQQDREEQRPLEQLLADGGELGHRRAAEAAVAHTRSAAVDEDEDQAQHAQVGGQHDHGSRAAHPLGQLAGQDRVDQRRGPAHSSPRWVRLKKISSRPPPTRLNSTSTRVSSLARSRRSAACSSAFSAVSSSAVPSA